MSGTSDGAVFASSPKSKIQNPQSEWLRFKKTGPTRAAARQDSQSPEWTPSPGFPAGNRIIAGPPANPGSFSRTSLGSVLGVSVVLCFSLFIPRLGAESRHYREAKEWHDKQQTLMAMLSAQKAVEEDPENADHLFLYGLILTDLKQFSEAEVQLRKALGFRPDSAEFHYRLAALLLQEKMEWKATLGLDRRDTSTRVLRGTEQEALESLEAAVRLDPNHFKARLHLGRNYYEHNQHLKARQQFEAVLEKDPGYPWLHYHLSMLHSNRGEVETAILELEKELELHPTHSQARLELGEWLVKISRYESALTHLSRIKQDEVHPVDLNYAIAKAHRGLGSPELALAAARKCLEMDPEFSDAHYLLGQLYRETGKPELARQSMQTFQRVKKSPTR